MLVQSHPYPFPYRGALLSRGLGAVSAVADTPVTFDTTPVFDHGQFHDPAQPTKLIARRAGLYRLGGAWYGTVGQIFSCFKNGAAFPGCFRIRTHTDGDDSVSGLSAIIVANANDEFTFVQNTALSTGPDNANGNWFGIEEVDSAVRYCLATKSASQAIGTTSVAVTFQTEIADVGGWFDPASSQTNFVVPPGVSLIQVSASGEAPATNGQLVMAVQVNGSSTALRLQGAQSENLNGVAKYVNVFSGTLSVTPGDIITVIAACSVSTSMSANPNVWFCIEEVPDHDRVLLYRTSNQGLASSAVTTISWQAEQIDSADAWTSGTTITVPPGYRQCRATFQSDVTNGAQNLGWVHRNGTGRAPGLPHDEADGGSALINGRGLWIDCEAGEEFSYQTYTTGGGNVLVAGAQSCLQMEFR